MRVSSFLNTGFLCLLFSIFSAGLLQAEDLANSAVSRLKSDIAYLASDELKGRDVGSEGIAQAGEYIAQRFAELGLETESFDGTPFQEFDLPGPAAIGEADKNKIEFSGVDTAPQMLLGENFTSLSLGSNGEFSGELVYAGYGITAPDLGYDDYEGLDVEGKVVIVIRKEPQQDDPNSIFNGRQSSQYAYFSSKELNAAQHKAAALIIVNDKQTATRGDTVMAVTDAGAAAAQPQIPTLFCKRSAINQITEAAIGKSLDELEDEIDQKVAPNSQALEGVSATGQTQIEESKIPVRNVIGLLPGKGDLADEYVVVGAHYDHVGMGGRGSLAPGTIAIHNGADDNASGTVTMMEVARRMAADISENRRSIVFMAFTGEERGLLGSKHYVRNPRWPLEKTVAMVNMDMVGRLSENRLTIYGLGTAKEFDGLVEELNQVGRFSLDKRSEGFGPSDHSSFYEVEIPVFHFFTGLHNDYHRPSDDSDKVNYDGMSRITTMITGVVSQISTNAEKPTYVKTTGFADVGRGPRRPQRAVMGVELDLRFEGQGVRINSVPSSGPAADSGVKANDVILKIDSQDIERVRDLRRVMAEKKAGDSIKLLIQRGEEELEIELKLGEG